jgi:hypothetical protein
MIGWLLFAALYLICVAYVVCMDAASYGGAGSFIDVALALVSSRRSVMAADDSDGIRLLEREPIWDSHR